MLNKPEQKERKFLQKANEQKAITYTQTISDLEKQVDKEAEQRRKKKEKEIGEAERDFNENRQKYEVALTITDSVHGRYTKRLYTELYVIKQTAIFL